MTIEKIPKMNTFRAIKKVPKINIFRTIEKVLKFFKVKKENLWDY
jgi:hypothetical protein